MNEGIEAIADITTGAVIAKAVEPHADGSDIAAANGQSACLNCGGILAGTHCHSCGQKAQVHRTLRSFGHDFVHSVLHFDGKIWRTLPLLMWKPGELTRRYIHGERAKFVSPLALFLFSVFFAFALFNFLAPKNIDLNTNGTTTAAKAQEEFDKDRKDTLDAISKLEKDKKEALASNEPVAWMDGELARYREALKSLEAEKAPEIRKQVIAERKFAIAKQASETKIKRLEADLARAKVAGQPTAKIQEEIESERMGIKLTKAANDLVTKGDTDLQINLFNIKWLNDAAKHAAENPQLLFYKIQSNAYKYSWALIPISMPFLWLLFFWRREYKLFDHAVFITYSLCFMMTLATIAAIILSSATEGSFVFVVTVLSLIFVPPVHIYRQLHHAYQTTRLGAFWRAFVLSNFAVLALVLFGSLIVTLGVI
jgi:hypothetical protein